MATPGHVVLLVVEGEPGPEGWAETLASAMRSKGLLLPFTIVEPVDDCEEVGDLLMAEVGTEGIRDLLERSRRTT